VTTASSDSASTTQDTRSEPSKTEFSASTESGSSAILLDLSDIRSLLALTLASRTLEEGSEVECAKDTGLRNLPLKGFAQSQVWCEIVALACELLAWTQMLALTGVARRWGPKRLRLLVFAVAARLASSGRRLRLRLAERWPWAADITRLQALPPG
jgi:hypothetical protein